MSYPWTNRKQTHTHTHTHTNAQQQGGDVRVDNDNMLLGGMLRVAVLEASQL